MRDADAIRRRRLQQDLGHRGAVGSAVAQQDDRMTQLTPRPSRLRRLSIQRLTRRLVAPLRRPVGQDVGQQRLRLRRPAGHRLAAPVFRALVVAGQRRFVEQPGRLLIANALQRERRKLCLRVRIPALRAPAEPAHRLADAERHALAHQVTASQPGIPRCAAPPPRRAGNAGRPAHAPHARAKVSATSKCAAASPSSARIRVMW